MVQTVDALVRYEYGQPVTTSLNVAEHFGKSHNHVMRDVQNLLGGLSNFGHTPRMFYKAVYQNAQNKQFYDMYLMNRDGFSLLVMGFTGQDALEWKLKYIKAFNEMEAELRGGLLNFEYTPKETKELPHDYLSALKALVVSEEEKQLMQPKADYYDACMDSEKYFTATDVAKELGMKKAGNLNALLESQSVLYRVGYRVNAHKPKSSYPLLPTVAYDFLLTDGYAKIFTTPYTRYLKWSNKGVEWLKKFVSQFRNPLGH